MQEVPRTAKQHAVYRTLKLKARQHDVSGARMICIGSDQSPVLTNFSGITTRDAVIAAFRETTSLSGALILNIADDIQLSRPYSRSASGELFLNPWAKSPIAESVAKRLLELDFSRWLYYFRLGKFEYNDSDGFQRVGGNQTIGLGIANVKLEVPCNVLIDSLAGKTNLFDAYNIEKGDPAYRYLKEGWVVTSCTLKNGNIEKGEAAVMTLHLSPPNEKVYWPEKGGTQE